MSGDPLEGELLGEACLSLRQLAGACAVDLAWVEQRVHEGVLAVADGSAGDWRFSGSDLRRARLVRALERDFDAGPELAALVADLLEEVRALRARLP